MELLESAAALELQNCTAWPKAQDQGSSSPLFHNTLTKLPTTKTTKKRWNGELPSKHQQRITQHASGVHVMAVFWQSPPVEHTFCWPNKIRLMYNFKAILKTYLEIVSHNSILWFPYTQIAWIFFNKNPCFKQQLSDWFTNVDSVPWSVRNPNWTKSKLK